MRIQTRQTWQIWKRWTTCQIFNFKCHGCFKFLLKSFTHQLPEPTTQIFLGAAIITLTSRKELLLVRRQTQSGTQSIYTRHTRLRLDTPSRAGWFSLLHTHAYRPTRLCNYVCKALTNLNPSNPKQSFLNATLDLTPATLTTFFKKRKKTEPKMLVKMLKYLSQDLTYIQKRNTQSGLKYLN